MATAAKKTAAPAAVERKKINTTSLADTGAVAERTDGENINLDVEALPAVEQEEEMVTAIVPKTFTLTLDNGQKAEYAQGTCEMPLSHAAHWFSRAQGVKVYTGKQD